MYVGTPSVNFDCNLIRLCQYKKRRPTCYGSTIYFNFSAEEDHALVKIQNLGDAPDRFLFVCDKYIESVQICHNFFTTLEFVWEIDIVHLLSEQTTRIKTKVRINPLLARRLRPLIANRKLVTVPLIYFKSELSPMILRKRQREVLLEPPAAGAGGMKQLAPTAQPRP